MLTGANIQQILDASVRDISKRVGKLDVIDACESAVPKLESPYTIYVTTSGDYQEVFSFSAEGKVLETIARNMMRGADINDESIRICAMEFFNILCGHTISSINKKYNTKTRFSIPQMEQGILSRQTGQDIRNQWVIQYPCGKAKFEILGLKNTN